MKFFKEQKGFTLIEVVFVMAIFFIIIGIALDIFISVIQQQKRILQEQEILNQTSYAMEYISKALRMATKDINGTCTGVAGYTYLLTHCDPLNIAPCQGVKFINQADNNSCQEFFLDTSNGADNAFLNEAKNGGAPQNLLSNKFYIKNVSFIVNGDKTHTFTLDDGPFIQPRITMLLDVATQPGGPFMEEKVIQTTVSPRNLHIQ